MVSTLGFFFVIIVIAVTRYRCVLLHRFAQRRLFHRYHQRTHRGVLLFTLASSSLLVLLRVTDLVME